MSVKRRVTVNMTVEVIHDAVHPAAAHSTSNITYEPLENGMVRVSSSFSKDIYDVTPGDLVEMVMAVCGGALLKRPDMQRAFAEAVAAKAKGNGSSIESLT